MIRSVGIWKLVQRGWAEQAARVLLRVEHGLRALALGQAAREAGLTVLEMQIIRLVAGGAITKQVTVLLHLSPRTISTHLRHAFTELRISSRIELTRLVVGHEAACHN
ncbi:helix-turn-helix domain-containing protein [Nonomuraea wenchangensis]